MITNYKIIEIVWKQKILRMCLDCLIHQESPQTTRLLTLSRKDFLKLYIKQWILLSRVFLIFLTIKFTTGHKVSVDILIYQNVSVTNGHGYIPFVVIVIPSFFFYSRLITIICNWSNTTDVARRAGNAYPSGVHSQFLVRFMLFHLYFSV